MYYDYFEGFEYYIEKDDDKFYIYIRVDKKYRIIAKKYEWYVKTKDKLWLVIESKNNALNSVKENGGIAGVACSMEEFLEILKEGKLL